MSRTALVLLFCVAFATCAASRDRTLVAEGDYTAEKKDGYATLAHWKLWHLSNGEYDVNESSAKNVHLTQTFRFDAQFMPIGYSLDITSLSPAEINQHPEAAKLYHPMSVSCDYKPEELKCATDYDGHKSVALTAAKYPYVFFPGEFYAMDFTWFMTGVVHLIEKGGAQGKPVTTYIMEDSPTNFRLGEIVLKEDQPSGKLYFTGEETATVMGKEQRVRRYESGGLSELSVLRVTSQGIVALLGGRSAQDGGFGIRNFVEYEPWTLPFHPVLEPTEIPMSIPNSPSPTDCKSSESFGKVRVSPGVMAGLKVHDVPPTYPEAAKQNRIEGVVVVSVTIDQCGSVVGLTPLSGPPELIPAALTAVKQWKYRPFVSAGEHVAVETQTRINFTLSH